MTSLIPDDISEQAALIIAVHAVEDMRNAEAWALSLIAFGMLAERTRCAEMVAPVSEGLATKIWGELA